MKLRYFYPLVVLAVAFLLLSVFVRHRFDAPSVENASASRFSSVSAIATASQLLIENAPHPVDSAENQVIQRRIADFLRSNGYSPEISESSACSQGRRIICARVRNVTAMLPGTEPGQVIMLVAHYDSVRAGSGASDDGAGVASLIEIARMLKSLPAARHGVLFLFTDGEETGSLGARAFVRDDARARDVAAVINLEARGTSGQSTLFETGTASDWLVRAFARTSRRPAANSTVSALYRLLPNDTDLSVFKSSEMQGLNFAFAENDRAYHTSLDSPMALDPASIQQQGDNAYDLVLSLRNETFPPIQDRGNLIYTDVLGYGMIGWSALTGWILLLCSTVLLSGAHLRLTRQFGVPCSGTTRGFLAIAASVLTGCAVAYLLTLMLSFRSPGLPAWPPATLPDRCLLWLSVILASTGVQRFIVRSADTLGVWLGAAYAWCLLAMASLIWLPGVSYLFTVPTVVMALVAGGVAIWPGLSRQLRWITLVVALTVFVFMLPIAFVIEIMTGYGASTGVLGMAAIVALMATVAVPMLVGPVPALRYAASGIVLLTVASAVFVVHSASAQTTELGINILYIQNGTDKALLASSRNHVPAAMLHEMGQEAAFHEVLPEQHVGFLGSAVPSAGLSPARLIVLHESQSADGFDVDMKLKADRETDGIEILFPKAMRIQSLEFDGHPLKFFAIANGNFDAFSCVGVSCTERTLSLHFQAKTKQEIIVQRLTRLPPVALPLVTVRDKVSSPAQDGDRAVVIDRIIL